MIYFTDEARNTALENIRRLRAIIAGIPGDHLSFGDAQEIGHYLGVLCGAIENEQREIRLREIRDRSGNRREG